MMLKLTASISFTFLFNSLYLAWYLTSSAPAAIPGANDLGFDLIAAGGAVALACEGPGDGW